MLKSVGIQTPDFFGLCDQYTQTEPGLFDGEAWFFNTEEEPGSENESIENVSPRKVETSNSPKWHQIPSIYGTIGWSIASMPYMWGSSKQKKETSARDYVLP